MAKRSFPVDPAMRSIAARLTKEDVGVTEIRGYIASHDEGVLSIFPSRTAGFSYEIADADVVDVLQLVNPGAPCTLIVQDEADVKIKRLREPTIKAHRIPRQYGCSCEGEGSGKAATAEVRAVNSSDGPVSPGEADCRGRCFDEFLWCTGSSAQCNRAYNACLLACQLLGARLPILRIDR